MAREIRAKMYQRPVGRSDAFGIDHYIWVAIPDGEGSVNKEHSVFPIPLAEFRTLLEPMTTDERAALYKTLIRQYFGTSAVPQKPSGLNDLSAWEDYWDAEEECATLADQATAWIEGLAAFDTWDNFYFTLQEAS